MNKIVFLAEYLFTFFLVLVVVLFKNIYIISGSIALFIIVSSFLGAGHLNVYVSMIKYVDGEINKKQLMGFILAQVLGFISAVFFLKKVYKKK